MLGNTVCSGVLWSNDTLTPNSCGEQKPATDRQTETVFTNAGFNFDSMWAIATNKNDRNPILQDNKPVKPTN
jgi:hypothetical protein